MSHIKQLALDIGLTPLPTLERFFIGPNTAVMQQLRASVDGCSQAAHSAIPMYLWGESGSGKTHLLKATNEALRERGLRAGWMDADTTSAAPFDENWSAVLLDEVHWYSPQQQAAAFNWFINATSPATGAPRWVLAAGDVPPTDLLLRDDLRSRLGWGHVFQMHLLDEAARRLVLRQEADARGVFLSDEVMDYVLKRFSRDLGSLMQLLDKFDSFALRTQRALTIPLLKTMLQTE